MVLWMLFFAVYSAIWPTIPIAPDMLGQVSANTHTCSCLFFTRLLYLTADRRLDDLLSGCSVSDLWPVVPFRSLPAPATRSPEPQAFTAYSGSVDLSGWAGLCNTTDICVCVRNTLEKFSPLSPQGYIHKAALFHNLVSRLTVFCLHRLHPN